MKQAAADVLGFAAEELSFDGDRLFCAQGEISVQELAYKSVFGNGNWLTATASYGSPISPPPFVAGFAEVEVDTETGKVTLLDYVGVVDCGTVVNPLLATVQAEGGLAQGIGMALYEDIRYNEKGKMLTDSFMQYKIPSRLDIPKIRVAFEQSYDPTGPFGAKSIGEVVINTPCPAIAAAIYNATGAELHTLPMSAESVYFALKEPLK